MKLDKLFISLILIGVAFLSNAQSDLKGSYKGVLSVNNEAIVTLTITDVDSLTIYGFGIYPDNVKFNFQGVLQEMNIDQSFSSIYKAIAQIQVYDDYSSGYEPSYTFVELTFEIEWKVDDSDGMPEVLDEAESVAIHGLWCEREGMDPENVEFELTKQ
jgi:hypothetical protein